jgi:hypothetical protein
MVTYTFMFWYGGVWVVGETDDLEEALAHTDVSGQVWDNTSLRLVWDSGCDWGE